MKFFKRNRKTEVPKPEVTEDLNVQVTVKLNGKEYPAKVNRTSDVYTGDVNDVIHVLVPLDFTKDDENLGELFTPGRTGRVQVGGDRLYSYENGRMTELPLDEKDSDSE